MSLLFILLALTTEHPLLSLAQKLARSGSYDEAITEYKRFIYFSSDSAEISDCWHEIARLYQHLGDLQQARSSLEKALSFAPSESIEQQLKIDIGVNLLAANHIAAAEIELLRVATFTPYQQLRRRAYFFLGIAFVYENRWEEARHAFHLALDTASQESQLIDRLLAPEHRPRPLSPDFAKSISTLIPGAGQVYAGDWRNGINALLINIATGFLTVQAFVTHNLRDAALVYFPLFYRYYLGNRWNAAEITKSRNQTNARKYCQRILTAIANHIDNIPHSPPATER